MKISESCYRLCYNKAKDYVTIFEHLKKDGVESSKLPEELHYFIVRVNEKPEDILVREVKELPKGVSEGYLLTFKLSREKCLHYVLKDEITLIPDE